MRALEDRPDRRFPRSKKNNEIVIIKPPKQLFKVVVNNYNQAAEEPVDERSEGNDEPMMDQQGLPPQPAGYLKFPTYDWF